MERNGRLHISHACHPPATSPHTAYSWWWCRVSRRVWRNVKCVLDTKRGIIIMIEYWILFIAHKYCVQYPPPSPPSLPRIYILQYAINQYISPARPRLLLFSFQRKRKEKNVLVSLVSLSSFSFVFILHQNNTAYQWRINSFQRERQRRNYIYITTFL